MSWERGKLLISTKAHASGRKTIILVSSIFQYFMAVFLLLNQDALAALGRSMFNSSSIGRLLGWCCILILFAWPTFNIVMAQISSKSYCDVYENAVVGITCLSTANPHAPMQSFELNYAQIVNVTSSKKNIMIHTNHGSYEILALKNCNEAVQEIRARIVRTVQS